MDFLANYVVEHFAHEEKIMDALHCPAAAANKAAHHQLIAKLKILHNRFKSEGIKTGLVLEIHDTLRHWLIEHISEIDLKLAPLATPCKV